MRKLKRRIRNLNALGFFEAAGRLASFSRAAEELSVTQGAVSRQIRLLEEALGIGLFSRGHRAVTLTAAGRRLHRAVSIGLGHIESAAEEIAVEGDASLLTIAATHAISTFWLMPRMASLHARFPDLELELLATDAELDEIRDRFDLGIRYGDGRWPGVAAFALGACDVFPVCSPAYLEQAPALAGPADLRTAALLHLDDRRADWLGWHAWFGELGVEGPFPRPALRVNSYPLLVQAAIAGQGVALGWSHLVDDALARGTLVRPLEAAVPTRHGFHLVVSEARADDPRIGALVQWFVNAFGAGGAAANDP